MKAKALMALSAVVKKLPNPHHDMRVGINDQPPRFAEDAALRFQRLALQILLGFSLADSSRLFSQSTNPS